MIYICDNPFTDRELGPCVYVWADAPGEADAALWSMMIDPEEARARYLNAWEAYRVPASYVPAFAALGLQVTDKFGPAIWCAERDHDTRRLEILMRGRAGLHR